VCEISEIHSDVVKKVRRRIEEKLRKDFSEEEVLALATLLKVTSQEKEDIKKNNSN
jgi:hypothetical protein